MSKHTFYMEYIIDGIYTPCITEINVIGEPTNFSFDKILCPTHVVAFAEKMYDLTTGLMIKDRKRVEYSTLTPQEIYRLHATPFVPLDVIVTMVNSWR